MMKTIALPFTVSMILLTGQVFAVSPAASTPSTSSSPKAAELYAKGKQASEAGKYAEAEKLLAEANRIEADNPDTLNMLAYVQRKQDKLDEAFANYGKALKLRPKFPEAREYLGEAHIQAALKQIETLKGYGPEAKEQWEDLVKALKDAAAKVR